MALLETLQDDWSSGTVDSGRWPDVSNATYVTVVSGALNVTTPAATTQYNYAQSGLTWDFTNSYLYGRVTTATVSGGGTGSQETYLMVSKDVSNQLYVYRGGNVLYRGIKTAGVVTETVMNATYNATNQAWWRLRHSSTTGLVYYAYSADGVTWTESGGQSVSWAITAIRATLMVGKFTAADPAGTGTFDNINVNGYSTPTGIAVALTLDDPATTWDIGTTPDGIAVPVAQDNPDSAFDVPSAPDGIAVALAQDAPSGAFDTSNTPDGIAVGVTLDPPDSAFDAATAPDGIAIPVALDPPDTLGADTTSTGDLAVPVALDPPTSAFDAAGAPDGIAVPVALDAPTSAFDASNSPDGIAIPVALDNPGGTVDWTTSTGDLAVAITLDPPDSAWTATSTPDGIAVTLALDNPATTWDVTAAPDGIAVTVALDAPSATYALTTTPDGIAAPVALDDPTTGWTLTTTPDGIAVTVTLDPPDSAWTADTAVDSITIDITLDPVISTILLNIDTSPNGIRIPIGLDEPTTDFTDSRQFIDPVVPRRAYLRTPVAYHIMGIGPANAGQPWRGAANYGIGKAGTTVTMESWPTLNLPEAQSKSFTLRLNAASEARVEHDIQRAEAIVIEEMITDLWWRRRDPNRAIVEPIGRFNADKVDIGSTDTGIKLSVTWTDYRGLLEDRMVLTYLDTVNSESQWASGTLITDILRFAIPDNSGLDLTNIQTGTATNIGVTNKPFELPPGTTIADTLTNLRAISATPWEWRIDMPTTDTSRPLLTFDTTGGVDNGITLFDIGSGISPIASWTMQTAGDKYANAMFYSGSTGGVVLTLDTDIATYGQRDASDSDSSLVGNVALIEAAGRKRLTELADRTPTWTVALRTGFWEGRAHIDVGDWITVHIRLGDDVISGKHRVSEITCDIDASGLENVSLTLGNPRPAKDPRSRASALARLVRKLKNYERKGTA